MIFHRSLRGYKSAQVLRTLLDILANLNNAVVWIVSTCPLISNPCTPCTNYLVTVPSASISHWHHCHLHVPLFFLFSSKVYVLISLLSFLQFYPEVTQDVKVHHSAGPHLFLLTTTRSGCLAEIRWSISISKSQRISLSYFTPLECFTSVLANDLSLEFERQHISSSL